MFNFSNKKSKKDRVSGYCNFISAGYDHSNYSIFFVLTQSKEQL